VCVFAPRLATVKSSSKQGAGAGAAGAGAGAGAAGAGAAGAGAAGAGAAGAAVGTGISIAKNSLQYQQMQEDVNIIKLFNTACVNTRQNLKDVHHKYVRHVFDDLITLSDIDPMNTFTIDDSTRRQMKACTVVMKDSAYNISDMQMGPFFTNLIPKLTDVRTYLQNIKDKQNPIHN
jgi:hypothetical protein